MSRDQVDIDSIFEQHAEQFECFCNDNLDFSNDLVATFSERVGQWKVDCTETRFKIEQQGFDTLYDFDAELCVINPVICLNSYKQEGNR